MSTAQVFILAVAVGITWGIILCKTLKKQDLFLVNLTLASDYSRIFFFFFF